MAKTSSSLDSLEESRINFLATENPKVLVSSFEMTSIREHISKEIETADGYASAGELDKAFRHLERAHVLGQSITSDHTRVHWRMLKIGWMRKDAREVFGQIIRIIGAATKTALGIYPKGNTGGSDVYFFKPMPIPDDLQTILNKKA